MNTTQNSSFHRLFVGLALALSGCGSSADNSDSGASTSTTDPTTASSGGSSTGAPTSGGVTDSGGSSSTSVSGSSSTGEVGSSSTGEGTSSSGGDTSSGPGSSSTGAVDEPTMSFFVSSTGSPTANLGGLAGADARCQELADAVGAGDRTWQAYLSVEKGPGEQPVHAKDRIGAGPWYNAKLVKIAEDVADLHTKDGDHEVFLDENGEMVPGQWEGSPAPNQHDILTGTNKDGTVAVGKTCTDWTSEDPAMLAIVGHSDGLGPMMNDAEQYRPWNSVHENGGCHDTAPKGGAGRIYCFAVD